MFGLGKKANGKKRDARRNEHPVMECTSGDVVARVWLNRGWEGSVVFRVSLAKRYTRNGTERQANSFLRTDFVDVQRVLAKANVWLRGMEEEKSNSR